MPKVSIIVPCYNASEFVNKCLDSLLNQTLKDIEIIAINDGSKDNTLDVLNSYQEKYPNIIKVYSKENGGVASVRNYGLKVATGEYIGFVDSDDYVENTMYETLYTIAKLKNNANVVSSNFYFTIDNDDKEFDDYNYANTKEMLVHLYAVLWNKIYRKAFLDELKLDFPLLTRHEDASFLLRLALHYDNFAYSDSYFYHYVQRSTSITNTSHNKTKDAIKMLEGVREYYQQHNCLKNYEAELEYVFIRFCLGDPYRYTCKIKDPTERKNALESLWNLLNNTYPNWHNNSYLKTLPGLKHKYWSLMNKPLFMIGSIIFKYK